MALVGKQWTKVSLHKVVLAWLRGERGKPNAMAPAGLLDSADLSSSDENRARLRFFYILRGPYFIELPPDTEWHEVQSLTDAELSELYAVNHPDWMVAGESNELARVAARKKLVLGSQPASWEPPILWGHDKSGPFTVLEGNNRLTSYVGSGLRGLSVPVFIGLSPIGCYWHSLDKVPLLIQDLARWS
jgi:hypothetical protein